MTESISKKRPKKTPRKARRTGVMVVGIGASAGGLEALRELVAHLDLHSRLCYVIVQHLSPTHTSMLKTLLERECKLTVVEMSRPVVPESNMVYVTPPDKDVEIRSGTLHLLPTKTQIGPKPNINRFFASLAADQGAKAVGVILSGTGADGASGLLAINSAGGTTVVQDPATARYDGMPVAALHTAQVDIVLPPAKIGPALAAFVDTGIPQAATDASGVQRTTYDRVIAATRDYSGFDLSHYKPSTVARRVKRRMALHRCATTDDYLRFVQEHHEEAISLARDVLISVTEFFRDTKAFEALGENIDEMVRRAAADQTVRVWVAGCATGEEAYSIAILFEESLARLHVARRYQIFATDLDGAATARGRQGRFAAPALQRVPEALRRRYFETAGSELVANRVLRENIVFSVHNLLQDPPFSRIDLISCRNLLIYFTPDTQQRAIELFHYALNPCGILFLGKSEAVTNHEDYFEPLSKTARIFRKVGERRPLRTVAGFTDTAVPAARAVTRRRETQVNAFNDGVTANLIAAYAPPSVVVTPSDEVVHTSGDVNAFLALRGGPVGLNIFSLIHEGLRAELRALIYKARREQKPVSGGRHTVTHAGAERAVRLAVRPLADAERRGTLIISFETPSEPSALESAVDENRDNPIIVELEHELATTREHLQTVVEELETSNEELQSLNEELQSANEELQSTNEELQTSNEELQSTNEELLTVNDELQVKSHELEAFAIDLQNIQDCVNFPLLVVDQAMRITRFVPAIDVLLPLSQVHIGDKLTALPWRVDIPCLRTHVTDVIADGRPREEEVRFGERVFEMSVLPYRGKDGATAGAVLVFPEVTALSQAVAHLATSEQRLRNLIDHIVDGVISIDVDGTVTSFSRAAEKIFGYTAAEVIGHDIGMLMPAAEAAAHGGHLQRYLHTGQAKALGRQREVTARRKDGSEFTLELSVNEMREGERRSFTGLVRDITERRFAEEQLFQEKELALVTLHSIGDGVIRTDETGAITYMNPVAERLTGCTTDTVRGHPLARVLRLSENRNGELTTAPVDAVMSKGETIHSLDGITLHGRHGGQYAIEYSASPVRNRAREVIGAVFVFRDVSAKHDLLHKLAWQARHDPLTGLVNRQELERRVEHALTSAKTFRREHALLFIDLDQFKVVNDTSGHRAGDELLRQITGQLMLGLRHRDTLARMGGDEFAVLLENCSVAQAQLVAEKMRDLVQGFRFVWEGKVFKLGLSIGVVAIDEHSLGLADVLSAADAACYAAKDAGRNRVQMHSPNNAELTARRTEMEWVFNIHQVLDENRFCLYFQPIQPLDDGGTTRWEVLLRMVGTDGQLILPGVFLPAAERYGLMANVDRWVVRSTLAALTEQNQNGHGFPAVSINMSPTSLADEKFLGFVKEQFKAFPVPPERVCFEITETAAIANFAKAKHFMGEMKKLGSNFALDDFGSGMSSFGYLRSLPVDYLKIDGAFVRNLARDAVDLATVECINRIGHLMGMRTVAEYAEDVAVIDQLRQIGIDYAQGYGVRAPVNQAEFSRLISG